MKKSTQQQQQGEHWRRQASALGACLIWSVASLGCEGALGGGDADEDPSSAGADGGNEPGQKDMGGEGRDGGKDPGPGGDQGVEEECEDAITYFETSAWPTVVERVCVGCHIEDGVAEDQGAQFLLWSQATLDARPELTLSAFFTHNAEQFRPFSGAGSEAMFVRKALGEEAHGGGAVVEEGSEELEVLIELAERLSDPDAPQCDREEEMRPPSELLILRTPLETFRKASVLFAARLPNQAERRAIEEAGSEQAAWQEVDRLVEGLMQEESFERWLTYAWNEVFFFRGMLEFEANLPHEIISKDFGANSWAFLRDEPDNKGRGVVCGDSDGEMLNWQRFGLNSLAQCESRPMMRYMSRRVAWSLAEEPLQLIAWIIQQGRPFTEILTTDRVAMNYYSSLSYYGSAQPDENPYVASFQGGVPTERVDVSGDGGIWGQTEMARLNTFRVMDSVRRTDGFSEVLNNGTRQSGYRPREEAEYPRAGLLTSQMFLNRYPNTDTNVNRHRSWAFYNLFLGVDILELADRRGDPTAAELNSDQPVIDDANCNVCHNVMDPVAGMFQDFAGFMGEWRPEEQWPPRRQPAMLDPGFGTVGDLAGELYDEGRDGPAPLQALAAQTVQDPRFARRMVEHAFYQVIGRYPMRLDAAEQGAAARGARRAYETERAYLGEATDAFVSSGYDMKTLLRHLVASPFFRARALTHDAGQLDEEAEAELEVWGNSQLTTLEMLVRRIEAGLGRPWAIEAMLVDDRSYRNITDDPRNDYMLRADSEVFFTDRVDGDVAGFYGGIDFYLQTERLRTPSSAMSNVAKRFASEVACQAIAQDFALPAASRFLLGEVEIEHEPATHEAEIRAAIATLHDRFLGPHRLSSVDLDRSYALFVEVQRQGLQRLEDGSVSEELSPHCRAYERAPGQGDGAFTPIERDERYTVRAYMAVLTALVLDFEFLHDL